MRTAEVGLVAFTFYIFETVLLLTLFISRVAQLCHLNFEELCWLIEDVLELGIGHRHCT